MLNACMEHILRHTISKSANKYLRKATLSTLMEKNKATRKEPANVNVTINDEVHLPNFSTEESQKILKIVNDNTVHELLAYEITKARATKLQTWKTRNGPFKELQDILFVDGFGVKVAAKFYKSLLEERVQLSKITASEKKLPARAASFITPSIDDEQRKLIRSCVSVRIGVSSVTWARLEFLAAIEESNMPCQISHWQHHEIVDKKLHLNDLVHRCLYVVHMIPDADCYLFENPQMAQPNNNPGNVDQQNVNIQKAQITAVLSYALCARAKKIPINSGEQSNQPTYPNLFFLRRFLTARLFNHLVGTERVSSEECILNLMRTYLNVDGDLANSELEHFDKTPGRRLSFRGNVQFSADLREMFSQAERYHREYLGQALLLNLAFVRLVLLQDSDSIATVTKGSKKQIDENTK